MFKEITSRGMCFHGVSTSSQCKALLSSVISLCAILDYRSIPCGRIGQPPAWSYDFLNVLVIIPRSPIQLNSRPNLVHYDCTIGPSYLSQVTRVQSNFRQKIDVVDVIIRLYTLGDSLGFRFCKCVLCRILSNQRSSLPQFFLQILSCKPSVSSEQISRDHDQFTIDYSGVCILNSSVHVRGTHSRFILQFALKSANRAGFLASRPPLNIRTPTQ